MSRKLPRRLKGALAVAVLAALVAVPAGFAAGAADQFSPKPYAAPIALVMAVLFLAAFFDPKRPLRILHFDLVALLAFLIPDGLDRLDMDSGIDRKSVV